MSVVATTPPASSSPNGVIGYLRSHSENAILVAGIILLALYPVLDEKMGWNRIVAWGAILIFVILAMGLNIVVGYAGLLDLGYAAFFAIGAYTMGFLTSPSSYFVQQGWVPDVLQKFWPALVVSWISAAIFGLLLGAPTLRLRGDYLAIVTLGFGEIVPNFFRNAESYTNGVNGVNPIARPTGFTLFGTTISFSTDNNPNFGRNWFYLILIIAVISLLMIRRFYNSRLGRTWAAMREDEVAAASMGVNLVHTKLWAFALGASFAGFAGSVYASFFQIVDPSAFLFSVSVTILAMVILGGIGNIYGVVVGAILVGYFDRIFTDQMTPPLNDLGARLNIAFLENHSLTQDKYLVFGLALVLMMLLRPEGLWPSSRRKQELHPESATIYVQEQQQMYDIHEEDEPAAGGRA